MLTDNMVLLNEFEGGQLFYRYDYYLFVPYECDEYTKSSVYFAGGGGEPILRHETIMKYLRNFQPNAVMLFFEGSGFKNMPYAIDKSFRIMSEVCYKRDIVIHDLIITGSSLGCATALRACPYYYEKYNITPVAMCSLDNANDWETGKNLTPEEAEALAEAGTVCYLYEQSTDLGCKPVEDLYESGVNIVMVKCRNYGHDAITVDGFREGCFDSIWETKFNRKDYTPKWYFSRSKLFSNELP